MLRLAEELHPSRPARNGAAGSASRHNFRTTLLTLVILFSPALPASADGDLFDELLPSSLRFDGDFERKPPSISFRRNESRAVEAPTRYPTSSLLKYSTPIGNTGLILRVKARPDPRRIVKLEIRF